ncbi:MAG: HAD-IIIA family hydrolase [Gammaproteobacteria bacterium]|nr:HAD-IIIA family hydrolase [Gammaproteobacteria bacterium]
MSSDGYRLVVFDWDGTLMDSEARIVDCLAQAFVELGRVAPPAVVLKDVIGLGLLEAGRMLLPGVEDDEVRRFIDHYRRAYLAGPNEGTVLFPGVIETLQTLADNDYLLAVATGKSRRGLDRSLGESGCGPFFHVTRCADEACSKPHPQMLLEIMAVLDVAPGQTLVIGDSEYDMQMASNAGARAAAVDYGVHDQQRLLQHGALTSFSRITELPQWLAINNSL